ncbi:MAG: lamin tail domain-containing protein [Nitrosopumilus sp.]
MNRSIYLVFSVFLLAGISVPANGQVNSDNVIINEVDINPPGNDAASITEWVELYNPTDSDIDLSGWEIAATTVLKQTLTISDDTIIEPGQFLTYSFQTVWFTDIGESVELRDENGLVIDKTPVLSDTQNDFASWQRIYDGYDLDSFDDWKFVTSTAGSSNGKLVQSQESEELTVTVSSEKDSYLFGEIAVIEGSVSEELFIVQPFFQAEKIIVTISGPEFSKTVTLYPDLNLNFKTTLTLHEILGINEGIYDVSVSYGGVIANTDFSVGFDVVEQIEVEAGFLSIVTDNSQYLPGKFVKITGFTSEVIPFEGLKFTVIDPGNNVIASGNLFPTNGEFTTNIFVTTVDPEYGTYRISGEYSDQIASATFEVVEDFKEDVPISLWTDKSTYGVGEHVEINGRLNQNWIPTIDLEITQTRQTSIGNTSVGSDAGFKILDSIAIMGDGSFSYEFTIPDSEVRLGDYRINVSKEIGSATTIVHAVSNPEEFVASTEPITVNPDKQIYEFGDKITLTGFIQDPFSNSSYVTGTPVNISISHEDGTPLEIIGLSGGSKTRVGEGGVNVNYDFTAIPETSGSYSMQIDITKNIFTVGNFVVKAQYLGDVATSTFSVTDPLELTDGAIISINDEVYGLGETVYLTGILPPTGNNAVDISLTKPDGSIINSGATVENQRLSWSWITPVAEKTQNIKIDEGRDVIKSNLGIYKIRVATDSFSKDLFFKVSEDPENDSISKDPLFVTTDKSLYKAGEKLKVLGNVITREQGDEGLVIPERVTIQVLTGKIPMKQIHESFVYPNQGGGFSSLFELPTTVFDEGSYTVKAVYLKARAQTTFSVANDFTFGLDEPVTLLLSTDKSEYHPGDTVTLSGKPNKLIYLEKFDVSVIQETDDEITCGSFYCGTHVGSVTSIRPGPSGSFTHQFTIPDSATAIGSYEFTVDADFETKSISFDVVELAQTPKLDTVIEKETRISEKVIPIFTGEKTTDFGTISPRVVSGSLITPTRGDESTVNLMVSSVTGTCIIGPDVNCLVKETTRKPGQIYDVVEVDGINLNVRYSGPDVRLEKFSILPESSNAFLPDANWNVEVIKEDQVSRFYYKVTYKTIE